MRSWVIGSSPDCDLVVNSPTVSGWHCMLREEAGAYTLEDLRSSNGTFVNDQPVAGVVPVARADRITLGRTVAMPWPEPTSTAAIRIGRDPDNDVQIDDPRVSGHHARVLPAADGTLIIEDLGSTNGTAVGSIDRRIQQARLRPEDTVYFGSLAVPAARLLAARPAVDGPVAESRPSPIVEDRRPTQPDGRDRAETGLGDLFRPSWRLALWPALPLILAGLVAGLAADPGRGAFALAVAALLLGVVDAATVAPARGPGPFAARVGLLGIILFVQILILFLLVGFSGRLSVPFGGALGPLVLAGLAGLALGLLASTLFRSPAPLLGTLGGAVVGLALLGGWAPTLERLPAPLRLAAGLSPVRWAFEGVLMAGEGGAGDVAEPYFPAATERMGPRACLIALAATTLGLLGSAALASASPVRDRGR